MGTQICADSLRKVNTSFPSELQWKLGLGAGPVKYRVVGLPRRKSKKINDFVFDEEGYSSHLASIVYDFNMFENNIYYVACDYRKQRLYRRVSHDQHKSYAIAAQESGKVTCGVSGLSSYHLLDYFDMEKHFTNDAFHIFMLLAENMVDNWKGNRIVPKIAKFCARRQCHPTLDDEALDDDEGKEPWKIKNEYLQRMEDALNCVLVPSGHGGSWQKVDFFSATSFVRGTFMIRVFVSMMSMLMSLARGHPLPYKAFALILSKNMMEATRPDVALEDVDNMLGRFIETSALHEGLYPESESTYAWHQPLHLPTHIPLYGPLPGQQCLGGERSLPAVKKNVRGMRKWDEFTIVRYSGVETERILAAFGFRPEEPQNREGLPHSLWDLLRDMNPSHSMSWDAAKQQLVFNPHGIHLASPDRQKLSLMDYEWSALLKELSLFALHYRCAGDRRLACQQSVVYRLVHAHGVQSAARHRGKPLLLDETYKGSIMTWMRALFGGLLDRLAEYDDDIDLEDIRRLRYERVLPQLLGF